MPLTPQLPRVRERLLASAARFLSRTKPPTPPAQKSSAAAPLIAFDTHRRPVWTPRDYASLANEGFMQNAIVYRSVRMIAEAVASVPFLLYAGEDEIAEHPLLRLVSRPNPFQTGPELIEAFIGHLLVSGNAYLEAVGIDGEVREIHALRPDRMKIIPGADGWPEAWEYTVAGRSVRIHAEPVPGMRPILHLKQFHATNDHYGLSPLEAAASAIDLHNTASQWNKALLDNSARPSGALVYTARDGNMTAEQYERLKSELESGFQGSANAGRPLLLEGGLDWKSMSLSPKDMDFIEARHVAAREIALALGVPPMLLGIPGDNTYATDPITRRVGLSQSEPENTHTRMGGTDWTVALDQLADAHPNAKSTSLVVSWFGTDLRAGYCQVRPAVDSTDKETSPVAWSVAGQVRATAPLVSFDNDRPAYGGTPSDSTVIAAIRDLKTRGHKVTLTPFILMDIPSGNVLPDPYSNSSSQPAFPWRGRITCDPAPGRPGSPDKTAAAATQVASFVGTAAPSHFSLSGEAVVYSGPTEWTLRRMILHYAKLAVAAGGVDAILIGSELRGLTHIRSAASTYPFVAALAALAADVKSIVGPGCKVTYAADWSEFFGHHPGDGTGDVHFHLDPLWSSSSIDAIAIDCYWPLSDWRYSDTHLDLAAGGRSPYDLVYLKSNLFAGEGFDWYYASPSDRDAQVRTPITDGAGKPWVFRYKDLKSWWQNPHFNRPGGIESSTPTAWVPQSKPVWLTEIGCPAVDLGPNQPNVFVDPKSSESFLPYYSRGNRDDLAQRRYLQAILEAFDPAHEGYVTGANPVSTGYSGRMIDLDHVHVYAWDTRPFPAFPSNKDVWGDGTNWRLGHWITGRAGGQAVGSVVRQILDDHNFPHHDTSALDGIVSGLVIERVMSAREALSPLELAYFFDALESGGKIHFRHRGSGEPVDITSDDLVETQKGADLLKLTRAQETELPAAARIAYSAVESDYRQAIAASRRLVGQSGRLSIAELALVMDADQASRTADAWLFEAWAARERAAFTLPPSRLALEPGDLVSLSDAGQLVRITGLSDHGARDIEARSIDPEVYAGGITAPRPAGPPAGIDTGPALGAFLDLPLLTGNEGPEAGYFAATRTPWPGGIALYRSAETSGFDLAAIATQAAAIGTTLDPLPPGPEGRLDRATKFRVRLETGELASATTVSMLSGANAAAIRNTSGVWEVIQFETATLVAEKTYELTGLLRGQSGTEDAMSSTVAAGARFVLLDAAVVSIDMTSNTIGLPFNWRYGPANRDLGNPSYVTEQHAFTGRGLKPLSPVHVLGRRTGGDLEITWIRRTRVGGDSWVATEIPLGEESERYEIDILDGTTLKRTLATTSPAVTYTAAEQTADFGAPQSSVAVRVYQLSSASVRGTPRAATL